MRGTQPSDRSDSSEMVARGADAEEVMRVVNSALGVGENAATD